MAFDSSQTTVTTSATLLTAGADIDDLYAVVHVPTGGSTVYIGGSGVTTSNGLAVAAGQYVSVGPLSEGDDLYGVVASSTQDVHVLEKA